MGTSFSVPGNLGNIAGPNSDGVLVGQLTATDPDTVLLKTQAQACLCITDDGGLYVNETTPANEATADDVEIVGTTLAAGDAIYIGHATKTFAQIDINISTQGDYTDPVIAYKYWNGTAWTAVSGLTDGTTAFEAATGVVSSTFTLPTDWALNTVDSVNGYWIQISVTSITASVTPCQIQQVWVIADESDATWTDDTTDFTDAGTDDVATLPAHQTVGDGLYIGYSEKFCKIYANVGTAAVGTHTITFKYWDGSAWTAIPAATIDDDSAGWSTGTSSYYVHFIPPSDWVANTTANGPNSTAGFFVVAEITAITTVTTVGLITQGWVLPMKTGASGWNDPGAATTTLLDVTANAQTASATNDDSEFLFINCTTGAFDTFTWTKADPNVSASLSLTMKLNEDLAIVQVIEDGTTEFADASLSVTPK
jgi:hypothetical protein